MAPISRQRDSLLDLLVPVNVVSLNNKLVLLARLWHQTHLTAGGACEHVCGVYHKSQLTGTVPSSPAGGKHECLIIIFRLYVILCYFLISYRSSMINNLIKYVHVYTYMYKYMYMFMFYSYMFMVHTVLILLLTCLRVYNICCPPISELLLKL